jgi:hypothetical protein
MKNQMQQLLDPAQCCFILYFEDAHPDEETARDGLSATQPLLFSRFSSLIT